jgi:hypothetical protein
MRTDPEKIRCHRERPDTLRPRRSFPRFRPVGFSRRARTCQPEPYPPLRGVLSPRTGGCAAEASPNSVPGSASAPCGRGRCGSRARRRPLAARSLAFLFLLVLHAPLFYGTVRADPSWKKKIDPATGLDWETLVRGDLPDHLFRERFDPQREYLRAIYGEETSTTYDLFLRERDRTGEAAEETEGGRVLQRKSIRRWPDPVVMKGTALTDRRGQPLEGFRLYACHLGKFVPIPYQFDEYTAEGSKVLPDAGPEANPEQGNGLLDPQDEFLFMAHDVGDRVLPGQWIEQIRDVLEITLKDPIDGGTGWCYLVRFHGTPPEPSPLDYAAYVQKYNQHLSFYVFNQSSFKVIGGKLYRQVFPQLCKIPDYAGGNFRSFIDRVKFRTRVRLFFGSVKIEIDEDQFSGDTLALRDGPVRCTRRAWGRIHILGFKTPRILADIVQYDTFYANPVELSVPINPGLVLTDLTLFSGTDLTTSTYGSLWYNSNNLEGFRVDGRMSERERTMKDDPEAWRLVTGPWGAMMNRSIWSPDYLRQARIRMEFTDDVTRADPPEYDPGQIGLAYSYSTVRNLAPGTYVMELDWYFPVRFPGPDPKGKLDRRPVDGYLNMFDAPLLISTSGEFFPNDPRPAPANEKRPSAELGPGHTAAAACRAVSPHGSSPAPPPPASGSTEPGRPGLSEKDDRDSRKGEKTADRDPGGARRD